MLRLAHNLVDMGEDGFDHGRSPLQDHRGLRFARLDYLPWNIVTWLGGR